MSNFTNADEILDFAIDKEQEAVDFYTDMAAKAASSGMVKLFEGFAAQEKRHRSMLQGVKDGRKELLTASGKVPDLKVSDYLVEIKPSPDMDYQDALTLAMQREKAAFALYTDLSSLTADAGLKELFESLAQEEAKHKLFLEREYDDHVLTDN